MTSLWEIQCQLKPKDKVDYYDWLVITKWGRMGLAEWEGSFIGWRESSSVRNQINSKLNKTGSSVKKPKSASRCYTLINFFQKLTALGWY